MKTAIKPIVLLALSSALTSVAYGQTLVSQESCEESEAEPRDCQVETKATSIGDLIGDVQAQAGTDSVALGSGANANASRATALGVQSQAAFEATAVGRLARADGQASVALGGGTGIDTIGAWAQGNRSVSIGNRSMSAGDLSVAVGADTRALGVQSVALGLAAEATEKRATALGFDSLANSESSTAVGSSADAIAVFATALGYNSLAQGGHSIALGSGSEALASNSVALGSASVSRAANGVAIGHLADAAGLDSTVLGERAFVNVGGNASVALGSLATVEAATKSLALGHRTKVFAGADDAVALGSFSEAKERATISFGREASTPGATDFIRRRLVNVADGIGDHDAVTVGQLNEAIAGVSGGGSAFLAVNSTGEAAKATGTDALALGVGAKSGAFEAAAVGTKASAQGARSVAIGNTARTNGEKATAVGSFASANAEATAVGFNSKAYAKGSMALGNGAIASHRNATAIGSGAQTTAANQVMLGGAGSSVVVADIASSSVAQSGTLYTVTIDQNGVLGRGPAMSMQAVARMAADMINPSVAARETILMAAVTDEEFGDLVGTVETLGNRVDALTSGLDALTTRVDGLDNRVGTLEGQLLALDGRMDTVEGQVSDLFDLAAADRRDFRQGLAAVAAMAHPHFPSENGKTSYATNVAVHRGFVGFSAGLMHRIDDGFALSAGVTYGGGESTTFKAGVAGEF